MPGDSQHKTRLLVQTEADLKGLKEAEKELDALKAKGKEAASAVEEVFDHASEGAGNAAPEVGAMGDKFLEIAETVAHVSQVLGVAVEGLKFFFEEGAKAAGFKDSAELLFYAFDDGARRVDDATRAVLGQKAETRSLAREAERVRDIIRETSEAYQGATEELEKQIAKTVELGRQREDLATLETRLALARLEASDADPATKIQRRNEIENAARNARVAARGTDAAAVAGIRGEQKEAAEAFAEALVAKLKETEERAQAGTQFGNLNREFSDTIPARIEALEKEIAKRQTTNPSARDSDPRIEAARVAKIAEAEAEIAGLRGRSEAVAGERAALRSRFPDVGNVGPSAETIASLQAEVTKAKAEAEAAAKRAAEAEEKAKADAEFEKKRAALESRIGSTTTSTAVQKEQERQAAAAERKTASGGKGRPSPVFDERDRFDDTRADLRGVASQLAGRGDDGAAAALQAAASKLFDDVTATALQSIIETLENVQVSPSGRRVEAQLEELQNRINELASRAQNGGVAR